MTSANDCWAATSCRASTWTQRNQGLVLRRARRPRDAREGCRLRGLGPGPRRRARRAQRPVRRLPLDQGANNEELTRTVAAINELPGRFETSDAVLNAMMAMDLFGRPDNYYETLAPNIARVTEAHLAAGARFALAVKMQACARFGCKLRPAVDVGPIRFSIRAGGDQRRVDPSGRPQIARICCSNCEVSAPSIVQWPLLCTRGAISLTIGPSLRRRTRPSALRHGRAPRRSPWRAIALPRHGVDLAAPERSSGAGCPRHERCGGFEDAARRPARAR